MIYTPENSLIQLLPVTGDYGVIDYCIDELQDCLPALRGDDIRFQIIFEDHRGVTMESHPAPTYILKVVNSEDDAVTLLPPDDDPTDIFATIEITEHDGFDVGTFEQPDLEDLTFSDFMAVGECFRLCLFKVEYWWTVPSPAPGDYLVNIYVDGVLTGSLFTFPLTDLQSIADALNTYELGFFYVEAGVRIRVSPVAGEVYGDLLIGPPLLATPITVHQEDVKTHCSNCFTVIDDPCFTSVVKYRGNEDSFGFYYEAETGYYNAARLPLYYDNPQPIDDENYFVLSNGVKKVLSARYEKEYEAHTEYFNEARHFQLKAATKHDKFMIGDTYDEAVEFTAEGKYDIGWLNKPGTNIDSAPANFKIRPTPYSQFNSNCE